MLDPHPCRARDSATGDGWLLPRFAGLLGWSDDRFAAWLGQLWIAKLVTA
jgi:hypothetical protein